MIYMSYLVSHSENYKKWVKKDSYRIFVDPGSVQRLYNQ